MSEHDKFCVWAGIGHPGTPCLADPALVRADERAVAQVQACDFHIVQVRWAEAVAAKLVEVIVRQEYGLQQWHRATADVTYSLAQERDAARAEVARLRSPEWEAEVRADERANAQFWEERWREAADQREQMQAERDAARAEVERWQERWEKVAEQRDKARARVAELEQGCSSTPLQSSAAINSIDAIEALIRERDAARAEVAALRALIAEGIEAFRLTKEYVNVPDENGFVLLPDVEGWSHWDWTVKARALIEEVGRG